MEDLDAAPGVAAEVRAILATAAIEAGLDRHLWSAVRGSARPLA
ncbi:hypothetical protein QMK19_10540 [Streptomyces sp. H10-C2]|nr:MULTISPECIES: hypothetical protein [unclassified Streptomyces]MDJ0341928.1 hypothetical protein [Streptomyces sp. PH10-H1]MDJ0369902.1 hypothetical protein [Streptomyces sp. H10-C2]MDJ0370097.1 hypothetical protein [Streptomyces sp. H10-C2]